MMHWLGFLGGPIDHDLALSLFERGCDFTNVQSCIWGSNISNMVEIADFEHSKTLAQRGCAMTRRSQFPEACVVLADLFWQGNIHNPSGLSGYKIDFASALAPYDVACRHLILRACARAIDSALFLGDADERKVLDWGNIACSTQMPNKPALPCYYAYLALERAPALQSQFSFDKEGLKAQLEENCLDQGSESCSGLSDLHRKDTEAPDKDAARFFAQRACDIGPCYMLEKIYIEDGAGADSADVTAFYLHRVIYDSTTMYPEGSLGKLTFDRAYFTEVVKLLQKSMGKAPDGRYKNSLYWALKQTFPQ